MTAVEVGTIAAVTAHARSVPATERVRFARAIEQGLGEGALVLETCHRVEAYAASSDVAARIAANVPDGGRVLAGEAAVRHAIAVAVGIDSVVLGEDQVLHQLRAALNAARASGALAPDLDRLVSVALHAGRRARSWRQGPGRSLADVALEAVERSGRSLRESRILVVGAGRMGRLTVDAVQAAGASVAVASRSAARAAAVASATGSLVETFDIGSGIGRFDGVIVALAGPWPLGPEAIDALARGRTLVVDLSVPAALPDAAAAVLGERLVTADALAQASSEPGPALEDAARLEALVDETTAAFVAWQARRVDRTTADELVRLADRERQAELANLWRRLPDLDPAARDAIEAMTRHLAGRLLRAPLERLGRDADGRDERAVRDIFAL
jgi:glutamyl-tRNA reductase